jgi:hypothetical protein
MDETEVLSFPEISERIYESRKVRMKEATIERLLNQLVEKFGEPPLKKVDDLGYTFNFSYYNRKKPTPYNCGSL